MLTKVQLNVCIVSFNLLASPNHPLATQKNLGVLIENVIASKPITISLDTPLILHNTKTWLGTLRMELSS